MDFTLKIYSYLLSALKDADYTFQTFEEFLFKPVVGKVAILRHDVDKHPANSLATARLEAEKGIQAVYYFRAVSQSWDEKIIKEIAQLGHEVGYHYESLTTCNGDVNAAYNDFCNNLERLRKLVTVKTICMHGSPQSRYDSKEIWKRYSYKDLGILGEPYFDIDFSKMFYLTDTGRRWDGFKYSRRDKVDRQERWIEEGLIYHSTNDIIKALQKDTLPERIMFTTHPQRWTDQMLPWLKELFWQNIKNWIKRVI